MIAANCTWNVWNFRRNLVRSLLEKGYKIVIVAPFDNQADNLRSMGCELYDIKMKPNTVNVLADLYLFFKYLIFLFKMKPDVLLTFTIKPNIYGAIAARFTKIRCINNVTGVGTAFMQSGIVNKLSKLLLRGSIYYSDVVFFQNKDDLALLLRCNVVRKERTDILPGSGVDTNFFSPQKKTSLEDKFTFLCVSRLIIDKGILELSSAANKLKKCDANVKVQVIGGFFPEHKRSIPRTLVQQWNKDSIIDYLGPVDDIRPFIADADCIVLPSYREGAPRSLMEASSMEKLIIAADVPGCRDVVEDGVTGFLCEGKSIDSLYESMQNVLLLSQKQCEYMGRLGRRKMEREFSDKFVARKYIEKIENLGTE